MHPAKILSSLIALTVASNAFAASKFDQFELKVRGMEMMLKAEPDISKRYAHFLKIHKELVDLKKGPRSSETEELAMSQFLDTLNDLPAKAKFSAKKCPEYEAKTKAMTNIAQKAEGQEQDGMVARAVGVVELVCKK